MATRQNRLGAVLSRYLLPLFALLLIVIFSIALPRTFPTAATAQSILNSIAVIRHPGSRRDARRDHRGV